MKPIIDISEHQGVFNWSAYKSKISGAIIRCGYGKNLQAQDDKKFARNVSECKRLGIPFGVYLYSYAKDYAAARLEASHVERLIQGLDLALPVFLDIEEEASGASARTVYYAFRNQLQTDRIGLYTGESYYNTYLQDVSTDYLWIAKYGTNNGKAQKKPVLKDGAKYQLWQYSSKWGGKNLDVSQVIDSGIFVPTKKTTKTNTEIAKEVIAGKWGNGTARKKALNAAGYNYSAIQKLVNQMLKSGK